MSNNKQMKKNSIRHLNAKSIAEDANVSYRSTVDSFKYMSKGSIKTTDRKRIIKEVENALIQLKKMYEL